MPGRDSKWYQDTVMTDDFLKDLNGLLIFCKADELQGDWIGELIQMSLREVFPRGVQRKKHATLGRIRYSRVLTRSKLPFRSATISGFSMVLNSPRTKSRGINARLPSSAIGGTAIRPAISPVHSS